MLNICKINRSNNWSDYINCSNTVWWSHHPVSRFEVWLFDSIKCRHLVYLAVNENSTCAPHAGTNTCMYVETLRLLTPGVIGFGRMGPSDPCSHCDLAGLHTGPFWQNTPYMNMCVLHKHTHTDRCIQCMLVSFPFNPCPVSCLIPCPTVPSNLIFSFYPLFISLFF